EPFHHCSLQADELSRQRKSVLCESLLEQLRVDLAVALDVAGLPQSSEEPQRALATQTLSVTVGKEETGELMRLDSAEADLGILLVLGLQRGGELFQALSRHDRKGVYVEAMEPLTLLIPGPRRLPGSSGLIM